MKTDEQAFTQQIGKLTKAIDNQNKILAELVKEIKNKQSKNITISLNTSINDGQVFVTKMNVDEITEQSMIDSFTIMLKALGHVLLISQGNEQEEKK